MRRINVVNSKISKPVRISNSTPDQTGEYLLPSKTNSRSRLVLMINFVVLLLALQLGWNYARDTALERLFINEITVKPVQPEGEPLTAPEPPSLLEEATKPGVFQPFSNDPAKRV